jgi:hypothetical protein
MSRKGAIRWKEINILAHFGLDESLYQQILAGIDWAPFPNVPILTRPAGIRVAVLDFDNLSGADLPDFGSVAQEITAASLFEVPGVVLINRDRLDSVKRDIFTSYPISTEHRSFQMGDLLHADAVISGSVVGYKVDRQKSVSALYNKIEDVSSLEVNLQVFDVWDGTLQYSKTFSAGMTIQYWDAASAPPVPDDKSSQLLTTLLNTARSDLGIELHQIGTDLGPSFWPK